MERSLHCVIKIPHICIYTNNGKRWRMHTSCTAVSGVMTYHRSRPEQEQTVHLHTRPLLE